VVATGKACYGKANPVRVVRTARGVRATRVVLRLGSDAAREIHRQQGWAHKKGSAQFTGAAHKPQDTGRALEQGGSRAPYFFPFQKANPVSWAGCMDNWIW
jgi:hypothetical protein